jgi:proliferating cell nuclear antigen
MSNLFKLIKFLNNEDELHMIYNRTSHNHLNLRYVNQQKQLTSDYYLNLLDLREDNISIGKQKFDFVITMPSNDFHSLIKNMSIIAEQVDIKFVCTDTSNYSLIFSCIGEFASQHSAFDYSPKNNNGQHQNENVINVSKNTDDSEEEPINGSNIVQGVYELKALSLFSRCSQMCPTIELYIRNDSPLVIKYRVADMGSVHLILSPINNNDEINNDDGDSENSENENDD